MAYNAMVSRVEDERVLILERVFDAPRELVFKMFKEPEHLKVWWGPAGWELPVCKIDFRPGGVWHYCMKCVDPNQGEFFGMESWGIALYKEIVEPKKILYTDSFSDAEGTFVDTMPSTDVTLDFIDVDGKTKLVNRGEYISPEALKTVMDMGMLQGITETWDRLEQRLKELQ
ncbi:SRPBCC domain-containing protein [Paenibacillus antri]|uniref:SRPBCC domain-containing protein n=1 Tax=Paenibacillus antri TaxID=2582848 RepID=A0A5R9GGW7_9BACL|nr:SRPBCC domain-containing protein [Paenibacillus antri]TLS53676.1 SRPBCC domain-containing protein [Paenibacillus antri]